MALYEFKPGVSIAYSFSFDRECCELISQNVHYKVTLFIFAPLDNIYSFQS